MSPHFIFSNYCPFKLREALFKVKISFCVFFIFLLILRIREKNLNVFGSNENTRKYSTVFGEYAESISTYMKLELFPVHKIVSEYLNLFREYAKESAKKILPYSNTPIDIKLSLPWRFFFTKTKNISDLGSSTYTEKVSNEQKNHLAL
jgi:hypothetical protein